MESSGNEAFGRWRIALADSLSGPSKVMAWQDRRYSYAYQVGQFLISTPPDGNPITDHVVYGVYVAGGGLVYVGQTGEAKRRLRDLPAGESHHLATTIPAEIWERVIVVEWPNLINRISPDERQTVQQLGLATCGLAMEYRLQVTYRPIMTARRRSTKGGWSARSIDSSRSRGAVASVQLPELFSLVRERWDTLTKAQWSGSGDPVVYSTAGRTVFPEELH
jgi:hypothetical protein